MQAWVIVERGEKNAKTREEKFAGAEIGVSVVPATSRPPSLLHWSSLIIIQLRRARSKLLFDRDYSSRLDRIDDRRPLITTSEVATCNLLAYLLNGWRMIDGIRRQLSCFLLPSSVSLANRGYSRGREMMVIRGGKVGGNCWQTTPSSCANSFCYPGYP